MPIAAAARMLPFMFTLPFLSSRSRASVALPASFRTEVHILPEYCVYRIPDLVWSDNFRRYPKIPHANDLRKFNSELFTQQQNSANYDIKFEGFHRDRSLH